MTDEIHLGNNTTVNFVALAKDILAELKSLREYVENHKHDYPRVVGDQELPAVTSPPVFNNHTMQPSHKLVLVADGAMADFVFKCTVCNETVVKTASSDLHFPAIPAPQCPNALVFQHTMVVHESDGLGSTLYKCVACGTAAIFQPHNVPVCPNAETK